MVITKEIDTTNITRDDENTDASDPRTAVENILKRNQANGKSNDEIEIYFSGWHGPPHLYANDPNYPKSLTGTLDKHIFTQDAFIKFMLSWPWKSSNGELNPNAAWIPETSESYDSEDDIVLLSDALNWNITKWVEWSGACYLV